MLALDSIAVQHIVEVWCRLDPLVFKTSRKKPCRKVVNAAAGFGLCFAKGSTLWPPREKVFRYPEVSLLQNC